MQANSQQQFLLGDIQVSVAHNSLHLGDHSVKLQPKAMAVLHYLAQHQERVVSAQELMDQLWAGRIVTQASVQKSINAIRSALNELQPGQEFIEFFSKRGYQLRVAAEFSAMNLPLNAPKVALSTIHRRKYWRAAVVSLVVVSVLWFWFSSPPSIIKNHKTQFSQWQDYSRQSGHQRAANPHPDNQRFAYITEAVTDEKGNTESQLLIRDINGQDWQIARTNGSWFALAWSPSGKQLAAVEITRIQGRSLQPDFYEKAHFLYRLHFFTLDLINRQLLEKQTLSQWQGRIFSISWWDEEVIEIVAKQGPDAGNTRYRYSRLEQQLHQLDEVSGAGNPYTSVIFQKTTALLRNSGSKTQIDFLNEQQMSIGRYVLPYSHLGVSWIPDGSGLLVFAADKQELFLLYRDGKQVPITLPAASLDNQYAELSHPVFNFAANAIYFTRKLPEADIYQLGFSGDEINLTDNKSLNSSASFSPDGHRIIYGKANGQTIQLMIRENGSERKATSESLIDKPGPIVWNEKGTAVFFNSGRGLYQLTLESQALVLLHQATDIVEVIGLSGDGQQLIFAKTQGDTKNLWVLDLNNHQEKQLTFGSLGATLASGESIYLQYVNAPGLWHIRGVNGSPVNINPNFPANTKLLAVDKQTIYFLTGGSCHESSVLAMPLDGGDITTALERKTLLTATSSFHPEVGVLQSRCYIPESRIVVLE